MKQILSFILLISALLLNAQETQKENTENTYILQDITVTGTTKYSKAQILRFTGLSLNDIIEVPGQKINSAIKKLWRSNLFSDVGIYIESIDGKLIVLNVNVVQLNDLGKISFKGIKKGKQDKFKKDNDIKDGMKISDNTKTKFQNYIKNTYKEKGFPDATVTFLESKNVENPTQIDWLVDVKKGERVKISDIIIEGNKELSNGKIRGKFKNTKRRNILRVWKSSKYNKEKFDEDLVNLIEEYKSIGFRDAKVTDYKVERKDTNNYLIKLKVDEGKQYFLGDVNFIGNTKYSTEYLTKIFGYKKGDIYDAVGISKKVSGSEKDDDINTLYQNEGYLFASVKPIEKGVKNDTINIDIVINEGTQATWDKVTFSGNVNTYDHVIQRSLRTLPGELFSKSDLKRTYFELAGMPFIEAQQLSQEVVPNPENNTVNLHWKITEKGASQVQLQGGYGAGRFIGTLGLSFGNFSLKDLFNKEKWRPIPVGGGQTLSLQAQAGQNFQNYSMTFVEPWIGGKKPTSLSVSFYNTILDNSVSSQTSKLNILGTSVGLNKLLNFPDNYFRLSQSVSYQVINFNNYPFNVGTQTLNNGSSNNLSYTISLSRPSQGADPIFPTYGSDFDISLKLTPPYSLLSKKDYSTVPIEEKYKWMEYFKVKIKAYWYQELIAKSVIKIGGEMGFLKGYNSDLGAPPFERFYLGGTGLMGNRFDGREIVPLRGYQDSSNDGGRVGDITPKGGGTIYNKFTLELRYPITLGQAAKIYGLTFLEVGNTWENSKDFKPFELRRAAGVGVRIFMPAFGLLGFDFGHGFDKPINSLNKSGWQTHFIIGQQF